MTIKYLICCARRTGSNWLCSLMNSTGLGPCLEFWGESDIKDYSQCVGLKVSNIAIANLEKQFDVSRPRIIYLNRRDRVRQAISSFRAAKTGCYTSFQGKRKPEPEFNIQEILQHKKSLDYIERFWDTWLQDRKHVRIWYENIGFDMVKELSRYIRIPVTNEPTSDYKMQRDEITETFLRRLKYRLQ